jgi:2-keto-4-pentenoate hydratase/2-oxohepta-3-ene-1,7-dioic acid hydratase in catechol pathway
MRFVLFGEAARLGLLEGDRILDIAKAARTAAVKSGFRTLLELIEAGQRGLDEVRSLAEKARGDAAPESYIELSSTRLRAPWAGQRLVLAGTNSAKHVADCFTNMGTPMTEEKFRENARKGPPTGFWAVARPVMGPGAQIEIPARARGFFDYEGEAAFVIGKRGKDIKAADAYSYIWGATLVNDWSIREQAWPPPTPTPLLAIKNFDCSKSIGPCISVGEANPDDMRVETFVNGERRQSFTTRELIFSFGELLEYLSGDFTFYPGDVITLGTGPGTAMDTTVPNADGSWPKDRFLSPGDTVEVRSSVVGSLVGHVVSKSS